MNLSKSARRLPRKCSHVPRPTFAQPAFGMIQAYPPGARFPKNMSVAVPKLPSAVALIAGAETGHSRPTDFATVDRDRDDPGISAGSEVPEEHVRRGAEVALGGRAHRGRRDGPLEADGLRHGRPRTVRADDDARVQDAVVRLHVFPVDPEDGRLRRDLGALRLGLRGDPWSILSRRTVKPRNGMS